MAEENITSYLSAQKEVKKLLEKMGVGVEQAQSIYDLFDRYTSMDTQLDALREKQFHEDAWEIASDLQVAAPKKVDQLSAFLRRFAEHIVARTSEQLKSPLAGDALTEFVDGLPSMQSQEGEENVSGHQDQD